MTLTQPVDGISPATDLDFDRTPGYKRMELSGLRLAIQGRLVALGVLAVYTLLSVGGALLYNSLLYVGGLTLLSLVFFGLIRSGSYRPWMSYVFVLLEIVIVADAVLTPNPFNPSPWPDAMVYRYDNFYYFFILIAVSVFSYSPWLVLWSGVCTATVWGVGLWWHLALPGTLTLGAVLADEARDPSSLSVMSAYLDPNLILVGGRVKEMVVAVLVSGLLAIVVWRGRRTVARLLQTASERALLRDLFGRYVPESVARSIIEDQGVLRPENRIVTVLYADIESFTATVARMEPEEALRMLNEYFTQASEAIGRFGGVITQFQGDALLATFNVPVADSLHARRAVEAGLALHRLVDSNRFGGRELAVRIGINTGPAVAGSVGGGDRLHYTVHGDAVNVAARLEELNKSLGTRLLVSERTRNEAGDVFEWATRESVCLRGSDSDITVFEVSSAKTG